MSNYLTDEEFDEEDFQKLKELYDALEPVKELTQQICSDKANLMNADAAFMVALEILSNQEGEFARDLHTKLRERYVKYIRCQSLKYENGF